MMTQMKYEFASESSEYSGATKQNKTKKLLQIPAV